MMQLICAGKPTAILADAAYQDKRGYGRLMRAIGDLRQDFAMVCGAIDSSQIPVDDDKCKKAARLASAGGKVPALVLEPGAASGNVILIGTLEDSGYIQSLMERGLLTEAAEIQGRWEAYLIKQVTHPFEGISGALVVAGSDIRGTIYGIYNLSEYIGVSPWYWWSDVPVKTRQTLWYSRETIVDRGPEVRYRGIFLNDEERLVDWAAEHFPGDKSWNGIPLSGPNESIYRHFFELLLRLGANVLWPAMHEGTTAFNFHTDAQGVSVNGRAADEYGIIMGSSHCEILLRNNVGEWEAWYTQNRERYAIRGENSHAAFDYTLNREAILAYWRERLETNRDFEGIYVLGIRGIHDGAPQYAALEEAGYGTGLGGIVAMQKDVISRQRSLIAEVFGNADAVAQVFVPYKEMNDYYNYNGGELASWLPEDVIIMYAEDNQGYLRQTPTAAERRRKGGCGVYYHNSYWGAPKSYLWLNSTPAFLMYEEMRKACAVGMDRYWVLNVGDLKPGELGAEIFLRMAWRTDRYDASGLSEGFYHWQGIRDYDLDEKPAREYAAAMEVFSRYLQAKKPEFFGYAAEGSATVPEFSASRVFPFSVTQHGDEGQRRVDDWNQLADVLDRLMKRMPPENRDAFYEQVYHAVLCNRNRTEEYVYYWKNRLYARQGRLLASRTCAERSRRAIARLWEDQAHFDEIRNGKWRKIIGMDHIIYYQPAQGILRIREDMYDLTVSPCNALGAVCEGQETTSDPVTLRFDSLAGNGRFIDLFSMDETPKHWRLSLEPWLQTARLEGETTQGERIWLTADWDKLPPGESHGNAVVFDGMDHEVGCFPVLAVKKGPPEAGAYSEANGYVVLEAAHFNRQKCGTGGACFSLTRGLGVRGDSLKLYPDLAERLEEDLRTQAASVTYRIRFDSAGTFDGVLCRLPTLNEGSEDGVERSCRIAVAIDAQEPVVLSGNRDTRGTWGDNVMRGYEPLHFPVTVDVPGYHELTVYQVDPSIIFDRVVITTAPEIQDRSLLGPPESPWKNPGVRGSK